MLGLVVGMLLAVCVGVVLPGMVTRAEDNIIYNGITFQPWTSTNSLPASGSYYLKNNVTMTTSTIIEAGATVNLLLNGHSITRTENISTGNIYNVRGIFNLYDQENTGKVTVKGNCTFVTLDPDGTFNMYGGWVNGCELKSSVSKIISVYHGTFNMCGGKITGNTIDTGDPNDAAVNASGGGKISLSGTAMIGNNTKGDIFMTSGGNGSVTISRTGYTCTYTNLNDSTTSDTFTKGKRIGLNWTANNYVVTFDKQSGTGGTASVTATYDAAMPSVTMPTRSGYTFNGYFT